MHMRGIILMSSVYIYIYILPIAYVNCVYKRFWTYLTRTVCSSVPSLTTAREQMSSTPATWSAWTTWRPLNSGAGIVTT